VRYHYSTQPTIAWVLNHHFYGGQHFIWAATPFYPYREPNPSSSNPYQVFASFYHPWRDDDPYDRVISSMRLSLLVGVTAMTGHLGHSLAQDLTGVCETGPVELFYPIVYRVDISSLADNRLDDQSGSAVSGSHEVLIRDLAEHEFDVLFADDHNSDLLSSLTQPTQDPKDVLATLKSVTM
jgi:hypothetical protein